MGKYKLFIAVLNIVVFAVLAAGFSIVGSPAEQQAKARDKQRRTDLNVMRIAVDNYVSKNKKLPETSGELTYTNYDKPKPIDPKTSQPYDYKIISKNSVEFCATFETEFKSRYGSEYDFSDKTHKKGYKCFPYTVSEYYFASPTPYYYPPR